MTNQTNTKQLQYNKVKTTEGQQKKHISQMNTQETQHLHNKINSLNLSKTTFSYHFFDNKRNISESMVINTLKNKQYQLIEYNTTPNKYRNIDDSRVLIRTNMVNIRNANLCIVISLTNNCIVTGYYNHKYDNHDCLNWSRYDKTLQILD